MSGPWTGIRFAALLLAHGGSIKTEDLRRFARNTLGISGSVPFSSGSRRGRTGSNGSKVNSVVRKGMNELADEGLVVRTEDGYEAVDLAELAAFIADEIEEQERRSS